MGSTKKWDRSDPIRSHAENPKVSDILKAAARIPGDDAEASPQDVSGVSRINDAIIPNPGSGVVGVPLLLVLVQSWLPELRNFLVGHQGFALPLQLVLLHCGQHIGGLGTTHHADARVGPHEEEARVVSPSAHAVISSPMAAGDDHCDLRNISTSNGVHHLGTISSDPSILVRFADHEASDVLEEEKWDSPLVAQLDEVRAFLSRFAEQDAIVGDDADGVTMDVSEATDQSASITSLELVQARAVDNSGDDLLHVEGLGVLLGDHAQQLLGVVERGLRLQLRLQWLRRLAAVRQHLPRNPESSWLVLSKVVCHSRLGGVDIGTAQLLCCHFLASGGLYERGASQENGPVAFDNDVLVRHRWHVGSASSAGAQHS
mmetsp:Transcript_43437/g.93051  ORF Transcript_43437/g.93051 Transcript_43437/m.93051 type:complete len:374 (+) Transcript_43437:504-1625(+)